MNIHILKKYILVCGFGLILCGSSIGWAQENTACTVDSFATVEQNQSIVKKKIRTASQKRFIRRKPSAYVVQMPRPALETRLIMSEGDVTFINQFGQNKLPTKSDGSSNLMDGDRIRTGAQSFATLQTKNDTFLTIASNTDLVLSNIKQSPIQLELSQGNVESLVTKQKATERKSNYQIKTPAVTLSVRGTRFKVMHSQNSGNTNVSVEDGLVAVQLRQACGQPVLLGEGKGAVASPTYIHVKDMLSEPVDIALSPVEKSKTLEVSAKPVLNAVLYRVQASLDESALLVVKEAHGTTPKLVLEGLDNGYYFVRLSAIDANGVEGFSDLRTVLYQPPPNSDLWLEDFLKP
ncbi:MAG: hypothetical protein H6R05_1107 [Burkholderiaceae bacterium]|nr:hypothetical protein [Burkholderiaceae bacterium]